MCPSSIDTLSGDRRYLGRIYAFERIIDAPRDVVFSAWTESRHLARWWGPNHITNPVCEIDPRPGGALRIDMRDPKGESFLVEGEVRDVIAPERISFTAALLDDHGRAIFEVLISATFAALKNRTKVTVKVSVTAVKGGASVYLDGMEEGWTQSLLRLEIRSLAILNARAEQTPPPAS